MIKNHNAAVALAFAILGVGVLALCLVLNDWQYPSMLLMLAGIGLLSIAIMLYFFSPSRYVRENICDAMVVSGVLSLNKTLATLLVGASGIHATSGNGGPIKVFVPISPLKPEDMKLLSPSIDVFDVKGPIKGVSLMPPGNGLMDHALGLGAAFTSEGLESEIKDILENGLELASSVSVKREGDVITVSLGDMVNEGLCRSIRSNDPDVCTRTGCPICSFLACMAVVGTGKNVRIEKVEESDRALNVTLRVL